MRTVEDARVMTAAPSSPAHESLATTILMGIVGALVLFAFSFILGGSASYGVTGAYIVGPVLYLITIPLLARQAKLEGDRTLFAVLLLALFLKLLGAIVRYVVAIDVYDSKNDAIFYDHVGSQIAEHFRSGDFTTGGSDATGSDFIELLTGCVYTLIGPTIVGGFIFFSWLGFLGLFLFYKAFTIALPEGRKQSYARLIFFLPSLLFWPSSIGKESWMMFTLGITAYGAAKLLSGKTIRGALIALLGLWWAALPRAHIAALVGLAIAAGFVLRRPNPERKQFALLVKLISLGVIALAATFFVGQATDYLQGSGVNTSGGLASTLQQAADRSSKGGSQITAPVLNSPGRAPIAIFTVLYRPTIIDAHNPQALLAAGEGTFLLLYTIVRFGWFLAALRLIRRRPYVAFSVLVVGMLIVALSSLSNLGILARERVQLIPFFLAVFCVPSKRWHRARAKREEELKGPTRTPAPEMIGARP